MEQKRYVEIALAVSIEHIPVAVLLRKVVVPRVCADGESRRMCTLVVVYFAVAQAHFPALVFAFVTYSYL